MRFDGKTALVTGSGRGIGRAIALKLASEGANVVINFFRNRKPAEETAAGCEAFGVRAHVTKADIGDPEAVDQAGQHAREQSRQQVDRQRHAFLEQVGRHAGREAPGLPQGLLGVRVQ